MLPGITDSMLTLPFILNYSPAIPFFSHNKTGGAVAQAPCSDLLSSAGAQAARVLLSRERRPGLLAAAGLPEAPVLLSLEMNPVWT